MGESLGNRNDNLLSFRLQKPNIYWHSFVFPGSILSVLRRVVPTLQAWRQLHMLNFHRSFGCRNAPYGTASVKLETDYSCK